MFRKWKEDKDAEIREQERKKKRQQERELREKQDKEAEKRKDNEHAFRGWYDFVVKNITDPGCRAINDERMVFKIHVCTWVYSKEDTMAHTRRLVVIS